jgi:transcriptional regulator with XRE-family HTH domain
MSNIITSQTRFFEQLKNKLSSETLVAKELAAALNISKSEAYSKLKGTSTITLQQMEILCNKYNLNFEIKPLQNINTCSVKFTPFHFGKINISQYIENLNRQMQVVASKGLKNLSCSTDDIPFFHLFKYKELAAFKLHFWASRIHAQQKNTQEQVFDFKKASKKDIKNANDLYKIYQQTPCTEIWTKGELLIIIDQLKYSIESKLITDKKLQDVICKQLLQVLDDIEGYAIDGCKNKNASAVYDWYFCDVVGNVSYLAERSDMNFCFLRFNTFNNIETSDESICSEVRMWLNSLLNDAVGFSGKGSKYRNIYLANLRRSIQNINF